MIRILLIGLLFVSACRAEIDSSQEIQAQIDLHSVQQIPYTLPKGRSYLYSPLIIRTNTIILGTGPTFGTVLQPMEDSPAFVIDGANVNGGWAFRNTLEGFTIDGSTTTSPELIVIKKAYSTKLNKLFIFNQISAIGLDISESNHIQLNELVMYGESKAGKTGINIHDNASVTINDSDIENYARGIKIINNVTVDIHSLYSERCVVNIEHTSGSVNLYGGLLKSINGYNIGLKGNNFNAYGTRLESYNGSALDGKVMHCFNTDYLNVKFQGIPAYSGYLQNANCVQNLIN